MAPTPYGDEDAVQRAREVRGTDQIQEGDRATLEKIRTFLQDHMVDSVAQATHAIIENYPDWWCKARRAPPGLSLETDADLEELYRAVGGLQAMGIPLTLAEKRTPQFRFFQDIEAWGTRDAAVPVEELIGPECELALLLGKVVGEVFPGHGGFLDAAVFDATGLSQTKGVRKTSLRLVWPSIVVDSDRAARVRDLVVHRLQAVTAENGPIAQLEVRLKEFSSANAWHSVFGDASYGMRSNVRMPLCDRVSPLPLRAPERRPLTAAGVLRFTFAGETRLKGAEWLCKKEELDGAEWVKIGSLRQESTALLTEWSVPAWTGSQPVPQSSSRTGRVKVRTAGGSDNMMVGGVARAAQNRAAVKPPPERAGQLLTVERHFSGSAEAFCEKMEPHLGKGVLEADGTHVWRQPAGDARIVMYAEDQRVKVIGRPNQVRSLVVIVSPYTEAMQMLGTPNIGRQPLQPVPPDGRAPSAAFQPTTMSSAGYAGAENMAEANSQGNSDDTTKLNQAAATVVGQTRMVNQSFVAEGQGELTLNKGDLVEVTNDPEGEQGDAGGDRWVYGRCVAREESGWFPLSHTAPQETSSPRAASSASSTEGQKE
jgi:hypothetical protein